MLVSEAESWLAASLCRPPKNNKWQIWQFKENHQIIRRVTKKQRKCLKIYIFSGAGIVTLWVKLLPAMTSHIGAILCLSVLLPIQLPSNDLEKAAEYGPNVWIPVICGTFESSSQFLASSWPSPSCGGQLGMNQQMKISLSLSFHPFLSLSLCMILTFHINRWLNNKRFSKNKIWIHSLEEYSIPGEKLCRIISGEMYPGTHMALSNKVRRREFRKRQTFWQHEEKVQEQHSGYYKAWTEEVTTGCWCLGSTQELRLTGGGS